MPRVGCCLLLAGASLIHAPAAAASSSTPTGTAPSQLVNAYPLGPQRLCCGRQGGSRSTVAASSGRAPSASRPASRAHGAGFSAVIWIMVGATGALLLAAGVNANYRRRRRFGRLARGSPGAVPAGAYGGDIAGAMTGAAGARSEIGSVGMTAETESAETAYRRADTRGDAAGAFNLGVLLHERGDFTGALAAYERAEQRGDPDAAFNLGVLLYEAGDLDGAERAWRRSARRGHARAAANLRFLLGRRGDREDSGAALQTRAAAESAEAAYRRADRHGDAASAFNLGVLLHERGQFESALAAYQRAEQRGDPDAAFNVGVLLYEAGDLDGAERAWRRSVRHGHAKAAANLDFLRRRRGGEHERAGVRDASEGWSDPERPASQTEEPDAAAGIGNPTPMPTAAPGRADPSRRR